MEILVKRGADVNHARNDGATPIYISCEKQCFGAVDLLLKNGKKRHRKQPN